MHSYYLYGLAESYFNKDQKRKQQCMNEIRRGVHQFHQYRLNHTNNMARIMKAEAARDLATRVDFVFDRLFDSMDLRLHKERFQDCVHMLGFPRPFVRKMRTVAGMQVLKLGEETRLEFWKREWLKKPHAVLWKKLHAREICMARIRRHGNSCLKKTKNLDLLQTTDHLRLARLQRDFLLGKYLRILSVMGNLLF